MKKIVHIVPTFELGGVQAGILYSIQELSAIYDFKILVVYGKKTNLINDLPIEIQKSFIWTEANSLTKGWIKSYGILKKLQPAIIISSLWKSVLVSVLYKITHKKTTLLGFYHSTKHAHFVDGFFLKLMSYFQDRALADSTVTKEYIRKKYSINNTSVIFYHFDFNQSSSKEIKPASEVIKFAYFGRVTISKGVKRAIDFCKLCKLNGIDFIFHIYGNGDLPLFKKQIADLGLERDIFINDTLPLDKVIPTMREYDYLLQLSDYEGMALSVVEALNCGLVPIVTPVGEIVHYSRDGKNAIWLDEDFDKNLPMLVDKLKKVINEPGLYQQLSFSGTQTFLETKKYVHAMKEVCDSFST